MPQNQHSTDFFGRAIYTLAQNETRDLEKPAIILTGIGSDLNNGKAVKGRAKRKLITQKMILSLLDVANNRGNSQNQKSYWNTYHCQNKIHTANGKLYGKYCKNRYCTLCCSIRKADIINRYLPIIQTWSQPYFVTLTVKAVPSLKLNAVMKSMVRGFKRIINKYRKRNLRGNGIKLKGIRSLECNFNAQRKTYNPHFHLIAPDLETADILIKEWLQCSKKGWAVSQAQKMSKVYDNQKALIEVVKYGSKIFTEPDLNKKIKSKDSRNIYASALDNIFKAMKGLRIFERFGFNLKANKTKSGGASVVQNYTEWNYNINSFDWLNNKGETLSDFEPGPQLVELLINRIDNTLF